MSSEPANPPTSLPATAPRAFKLPNARHASRVPEDVTPADIARIQQAAYQLPQVVKPADYIDEHTPHFEQHLDGLGLILLQKAVSGGRPSRWIAPEHVGAALRHLDSVGNGPQVRAQMLARTAELEALGITREAGRFDRFLQHDLRLPASGVELRVAWRQPIADAPVWDFHRTGDIDALLAAIGEPPPYPDAAELVDHVDRLLARAESGHPDQLGSLVQRLQAEVARPQAIADLKASLVRAQDRWERHVAELTALAGLN